MRSSIYPKKAGIYKITCSINGKIYIGKAINIQRRIATHRLNSLCVSGNGYFQRATIKYGWDSFNVEVLEAVDNFDKLKDNDNLLKRESYYIEYYNSTDPNVGYNICKFSNDRTGMSNIPHTPEAKEKMRLAGLGRKHSEKTKEKIRLIKSGLKHSAETKEKIRQGNLNKIVSDETRKKLSESSKGKPKSREAVEKTRQSNLGRKASDETKEKMRKARLKFLSNVENLPDVIRKGCCITYSN